MGKHALKAKLPRTFGDHRRSPARRLRTVFDEIGARFPLADGLARQVAVITALAFLDAQALTAELAAMSARRVRDKATILGRLRRRQGKAWGSYLSGLRALEALTSGHGQREDLAAQLARLHRERSRA